LSRLLRAIHFQLIVVLKGVKRRPFLFLSCFALLILTSVYGLQFLKVNYSTFELLDRSLLSYESARTLRDEFGDKNILTLQIRKEEDFTQQDLCELYEIYEADFLLSKEAEVLSSPFDWRQGTMTDGRIWFPLVLSKPCQIEKSLKQILSENPASYQSFYFGADQRSLVFILRIHGKDIVEIQERLEMQIRTKLEASKSGLKSFWLGEPVYERHMKAGNESMGLVNFVAVIVIIFFLFFFFHSKIIFGMFLMAVLPAIVVIHGLMGILGHDLNLLSLGVFLMLLVAVIEDFSFVFSGIDFRGLKWRKNFRQCLWPGFLTSLTTVLGFGSLVLTDVQMVRRFGFYMALGAILEWALLFIFIPSVLHLLKNHPFLLRYGARSSAQPRELKPSFFSQGMLSRKFVLLGLVLVPLGFVALFHLNLNTTPSGLFSKQHPINLSRAEFLKNLNYDVDLSLLFSRSVSSERVAQVLEQIRANEIVSRIESLDGHIADALQKIPEEFRNGLDTDMKYSAGAQRFRSTKLQERAVIHLKVSDLQRIQSFIRGAEKTCGNDCEVVGAMASFAELGMGVLKALQESLFVGSLLVFLTLFFVSRSRGFPLGSCFLVSATALVAPMAILCLFAFFQVEMNLVNCLCFSGLLGIAGDNIFQYVLSGRRHNLTDLDIVRKWKPSLFVGLTMCFLCLSFVVSAFVAVRSLGIWLCGGFALGLLTDYFFTRALLLPQTRAKGSTPLRLT
jgi:predicted RND superfamily exporter protein